MKRVTGIGGIFFKSPDPQALTAWYCVHLGLEVQAWGGAELPGSSSPTPKSKPSSTKYPVHSTPMRMNQKVVSSIVPSLFS